jgi:PAS domain S-box-containing protein
MNAYLAIPLFACTASTAVGSVILMMGVNQRTNRLAGYLLLGSGYWAFCEVLWNMADDAQTAMWLQRMAIPGWAFMAPIAVQLILELIEFPQRWLRSSPPFLLAACGGFLVVAWTTPWVVEDMRRVPWGWALVGGPVYFMWAGFTVLSIALALGGWARTTRGSRLERRGGPGVGLALGGLLGVGLTSEVILPAIGFAEKPRLGSLCFAAAGLWLVWALDRYGYNRLSPHSFARRILRTLPDGIIFTSLHGRVRVANNRMADLVGSPSEQIVGRNISELIDVPVCDPPRELQEEGQLYLCDGRTIPVAISSTPLYDNNRQIMGVALVVRDLREMAALRTRVVTSGRLAAVGQLAAGMAHEINNPLAFIRANLGHLRRECSELVEDLQKRPESAQERLAEWEELIDESIEGADRAATIVRDVREFSHSGDTGHEVIDLNALLDQVLRMAAPHLGKRISVARSYAAPSPSLRCAPQRLKQLFLNLVVNAAQAIGEVGRIEVATSIAGGRVHVEVRDDGCGVPGDKIERIFDPFFTTKSVGEGTGLGLSISHQIVRDHGGEIVVESQPGQGATFGVSLPLTESHIH